MPALLSRIVHRCFLRRRTSSETAPSTLSRVLTSGRGDSIAASVVLSSLIRMESVKQPVLIFSCG